VSEIGPSPVVRQTSAGWLDSNPMRYFFLGGDRKGIDKEITGPVYTNVRIWEAAPCVNPCEGHCVNGAQDCVEETVDKGGKCAPDTGHDAGVPDTGETDAGTVDAGERDTGPGHDVWYPDRWSDWECPTDCFVDDARRCADEQTYQICEGVSPCRLWSDPKPCGTGFVCEESDPLNHTGADCVSVDAGALYDTGWSGGGDGLEDGSAGCGCAMLGVE